MRPSSELELSMEFYLRIHKYPFVREFRFHPTRKWRADFVVGHPSIDDFTAELAHVVARKDVLLLETEGVTFSGRGGGHQRGAGYRKDLEKYNEAMLLGWRVLRVMQDQVKDGSAIEWVERYFSAELPR